MLIIHLKDIIEVHSDELLEESHIPLLPASKIASGTFREERIPAGIARTREVIALIQNALDGEIDLNHTHPDATETTAGFMSAADKVTLDNLSASPVTEAQIVTLAAAISGKAPSAHQHTIADVAGLQAAIESVGGGTIDSITGLQTALDDKAEVSHTHALATTIDPGFMSAADKAKLDGLGSGTSSLSSLTYTVSQSHSVGYNSKIGTYANLIDGSFSSGAIANGDYGPYWIKADLGEVKTLSYLTLGLGSISPFGAGDDLFSGVTIEFSTDDSLWITAHLNLPNLTYNALKAFALFGCSARYVRIIRSGTLGLSELTVYG